MKLVSVKRTKKADSRFSDLADAFATINRAIDPADLVDMGQVELNLLAREVDKVKKMMPHLEKKIKYALSYVESLALKKKGGVR